MHTVLLVLGVLLTLALVRRLSWRHWHHHRRSWLQRLSRRLDASPEQQTELAAAARELQQAVQPLRQEWLHARADLAAVLGAETLDTAALDAAFARQDEALKALRTGVAAVVARLHQTLDARQRALLAGMLTGGHRHAC